MVKRVKIETHIERIAELMCSLVAIEGDEIVITTENDSPSDLALLEVDILRIGELVYYFYQKDKEDTLNGRK